MSTVGRTYEQLHSDEQWAYGRLADAELMQAAVALPPGRAVDLGGGQGRHALALAALGFDVEVVDTSDAALRQLGDQARAEALALEPVRANIAFYRPPPGLRLAVAALIFHVPARHASLQAARAVGGGLEPEGMFYMSVPGFSRQTRGLVSDLFAEAGCSTQWCVNHVVTRAERPRLPVSRRNETRALGIRKQVPAAHR
ncbi:MAG: hypothetical protein WD602_06115 [Actinomycetota bacterium]